MRIKLYNFIILNKDKSINTIYPNIRYSDVEHYLHIYWGNQILKNTCDYKIEEVN